MGQKLSNSKESVDVKVLLTKEYPNYKFIKILNNGILYKSILLIKDKAPLVAKIFIKKYYTEEDRSIYLAEKTKYLSLINNIKSTSKKT